MLLLRQLTKAGSLFQLVVISSSGNWGAAEVILDRLIVALHWIRREEEGRDKREGKVVKVICRH